MSETYEIQIQTVFSADACYAVSSFRERALGLLTFLVGIAWLYTALNPAWSWVERKATIGEIVMLTGEMKGDGSSAGAQGLAVLGNLLQNSANGASASDKGEDDPPVSSPVAREPVHGLLAIMAVGWLGLTVAVGLWLAMAGIAGLTSGAWMRRVGGLLVPVGALALGVLVWYVWKKYEWYESILPEWVRPAIFGLLVFLAVSLGAWFNRRGVGTQRAAGYLVVLSAFFSLAAIGAAVRWGEMPAGHVDMDLYMKVFAAQSAYGWFLLLATIGLG